MSAVRNTVLTLVATGALVIGLLVLIPAASAAVQPQAPLATLSDRDTGTADTLRTTLTVQVLVPAGEFIPLGYASVLRSSGAPSFTSGTLNGVACPATITQISGPAATFGQFNGYGYSSIAANGYGYGYSFSGSQTAVDFSGYSAGYALGYGYGYGSSVSSTLVTVTIVTDGCPNVADFGGNTFAAFNFQVFVGGDATHAFRSLPATGVNLRNPEVPFPPASTIPDSGATTATFSPSVQSGLQTVFGFFAFDGDGIIGNDDFTGTGINLPLAAGTFGSSLTLNLNSANPLPEGATLQVSFIDGDTGGVFTPTSGGLGIPGSLLSTLTGGIAPAGFFSVTCTGCDPAVSLTDYIDLVVVLDIPQTYFTGPPTLNPSSFRLLRFTDAGARATTDPSCTLVGAANSNADYRYTCTLTDFSAFAMVAASFGGGIGGGGGGGGSPFTPPSTVTSTSTSTSTKPSSTSGTPVVPGDDGGDGSDGGDGGSDGGDGSDGGSDDGDDDDNGIPGIGPLGALAAIGLAAAAVAISRRKLK